MKFYTRFDSAPGPVINFEGVGRTKQSFKEECDINTILKRFNQTGQLPDMIKANPQYGDFADVLEYQDSMNVVIHANEQFAALPAKARDRFNNDPAKFLEFVANPENNAELVKMGLAKAIAPTIDSTEPVKGEVPKGSKKPVKTQADLPLE